MKTTTTFNRIEKVTYIFDKHDIKEALLAYAKVKKTSDATVEMNLVESADYMDDVYNEFEIHIIVNYTQQEA